MLSGLKRKKFSAGARRVASWAAEAPLMKVTSGTLLAKSRSAMPSIPARGPMTMLAPPSISRRAFATTDSGVPSVDSIMASMGRSPLLSSYSFMASSWPRRASCPSGLNAPSSVASTPIFRVSVSAFA